MKTRIHLSLGSVLLLAAGLSWAGTDTIATDEGELRITPILHGSLQLEHGDLVIQVDPWSQGDYSGAPPADLILITDIHGDHFDAEAIDAVKREETALVAPYAVVEKLGWGVSIPNGTIIESAGVRIQAVPMYNLERGPEEGKLYHEKGRGNGYVLTLGGKRVYLAGDTACIPEMRALENIDVAFVPMNLPYTMTPEEAAACVAAFQPAVVYPYHYRGSDLALFEAGLAEVPSVEVRIREWYPASE
jgi:L-ascorbate metabolism protein UlaG (beta-lactamase superfamily)